MGTTVGLDNTDSLDNIDDVMLLSKEFPSLSQFDLNRYLTASNDDFDKAKTMILSNIEWRKEFQEKYSGINTDEVRNMRILYCHGRTKDNNPICYAILNGKGNNINNQKIKYVVDLFDTVINEKKQMIWIVDFSEFKISGKYSDTTDLMSRLTDILDNNYSEMLKKMYIVNLPWYLSIVIKIVSIMLDQRTKDKIIYATKKTLAEAIKDEVDINVLDKKFGGNKVVSKEEKINWEKTIEKIQPLDEDGYSEVIL